MSDEAAAPSGADAIRADIEQTRAELAETVDALTDKLDVKARAGDKVAETKAKVADAAHEVKAKAPEPVRNALDAAGATVGPLAHSAAEQAKPYRKQILIGAVVAAVVFVVVRKKRG